MRKLSRRTHCGLFQLLAYGRLCGSSCGISLCLCEGCKHEAEEMLYHPDVWLRLEALKLGCKLLEDADQRLQEAFRKWLGSISILNACASRAGPTLGGLQGVTQAGMMAETWLKNVKRSGLTRHSSTCRRHETSFEDDMM